MKTFIAAITLMLTTAALAGAGEPIMDFDGRAGGPSFSDLLADTAMPAAAAAEVVAVAAGDAPIPDGERALGFIPPVYDNSHLRGKSIIPTSKRGSENFPPRYDLRELGRVSPVKNQGACGSCWAFATLAALESALLPGEAWDFSEQNVKNTVGFDRSHCDGGNAGMVTSYLARWAGPVTESEDPYNVTSGESSHGLAGRKRLQEALTIPPRVNALDNRNIKWALTSFGAVASSMYWNGQPLFYNKGSAGYYYSGPNAGSNHLVTIVGWDDNYDKSNFSRPAPGNGAFIVKNSWGEGWGDKGFFYLSYYDTVFGKYNTVYSAVEGAGNYGSVYQYDPLGPTDYTDAAGEASYFANVFTARKDETLTAAGFYTSDLNVRYEAAVYVDVSTSSPVNGLPVSVSKGTIDIPGFHTVTVPAASIAKGQRFSVVIRFEKTSASDMVAIESPQRGASRASANPGESYISGDGANWSDLTDYYSDANVCLKAYTRQ